MSYQYFDELPDDAKAGRYKNKLSLLGKITSIYLVFYLLLSTLLLVYLK